MTPLTIIIDFLPQGSCIWNTIIKAIKTTIAIRFTRKEAGNASSSQTTDYFTGHP